jgi:hypothetical protein
MTAMTVTETAITTPTLPTFTLATLPSRSDVCERILKPLGKIFKKYESWYEDYQKSDHLSRRLDRWGDVIRPDLLTMEPYSLKTLIENCFNELVNEILVDPLYKRQLKSPVLERKWTWERDVLADYMSLTKMPLSPFDLKPLAVVKPHEFALEMVLWANSLKSYFSSSCSLVLSSPLTPSRDSREYKESPVTAIDRSSRGSSQQRTAIKVEERMVKWMLYLQLAREAAEQQSEFEKQEKLKDVTRCIAEMRVETDKRIDEEGKKFEERLDSDKKHFTGEINTLKEIYDTTRGELRSQLDDGKKKQERLETRLDCATKENGALKSRVQTLETANANLSSRAHQLEQEVRNSGGDCVIQ